MRTQAPEDCDGQCKSQAPPFQCCGGCPVQCACRLEAEADLVTSREDMEEARYFGYDEEEI